MTKLVLCLAALTITSLKARFYEHKERHLGPTGLFGVTSPTEIKITKVTPGSPADGKIKVGDILVGANGASFQNATRKQLAAAIDYAESKEGDGQLVLVLKSQDPVILQLPVLGSYSRTAPFNCPKTDAIISRTADTLVKSGKYGRGGMNIGLLGLLATGEDKYIKVVHDILHSAAWAKPDFEVTETKAWYLAYTNLLLCEYHLLTNDDYVLPAIKNHSLRAAKGRDAGGLWGHPIATNGRLPGYAQMNCTSAPMFLSLALAEKCGIDHPEIKACLAQNRKFYQGFVGKGAIPYGVHDPLLKSFDDNGKGAPVGLAFATLGDKEGARFFSLLSLAAHGGLERGHTGHYFNQLWTGLAANLCGPRATAAFFQKTSWLHTMNRTWDGSFTYDCSAYKNGIYSYRGLSDAGSHLLNYCRGRAKLHITGKNADKSLWLTQAGIEEALTLADYRIKEKNNEELFRLFGHPMPQIRVQAIWALRSKEHKFTEEIREMIKFGSRFQRISACGYFGYGCPQELSAPSLESFAEILRDPKEDLELRATAGSAICHAGPAGRKYFPDLLRVILEEESHDTLGYLDGQIGRGLNFLTQDPYADKLVADSELFYSAIEKLLSHKRHPTRTSGAQLIKNMPIEEFHQIADQALAILRDEDRTFHSYHGLGPQTNVIEILANLKIEGGIEAGFRILESKEGKAGFKIRLLLKILPIYGANAKTVLPKIKATNAGKFQNQWDDMVKKIEASAGAKKMITVEEARRLGMKK
ncbi:PDZ domain-containing protein [Akkermansiaceae bacterium]|jgi:hypothetical protein|nr:PDZ domain-containing protein [bacterium]MDB4680464.1 PDZ domain-containing protein [Akkermansiaceae bacterium]